MNLFTKRFGLVLAGVVGVGAVAALAIGASFALFTAQTSTGPQTFTAGSVSFNGTSFGSCSTDIASMEPGDSGTCDAVVNYTGSLPVYLGAEASATGDLTPELTFSINGVTQTSSTPVLIGNSATDGDGNYTADISYTLSSSAGNSYQLKHSNVNVTFYAVQCSNNGPAYAGQNEGCAGSPTSWTESPLAAQTGTNGVSIVNDNGTCSTEYNGSPCFGPPNTGLTGGTVTDLLVTTEQDDALGPYETVSFTWNGNMTFGSSSDASAACTSSANSATCSYTDSHSQYKSVEFAFTVGSNTPGTVITTNISVATGTTSAVDDGGTATAQADITTG